MRYGKRFQKKWLVQKEWGNALASRVSVITQVYYLKRDSLYIQLYKDQEKNKENFPYFSICRFSIQKQMKNQPHL